MALIGLVGKKNIQTQGFLQDGTRVPLTVVSSVGNTVTQVKTLEKDGYNSLQLGFEIKKKADKAIIGHSKKAGLEKGARFFKEIKDADGFELGSKVSPSEIFKPGDIVDVTGLSKGKGFAGVVKRHHFKGGPRTHGQSDRERAPGSIGQTTTPGHVYKGKRMAGRMGHGNITVKNLEVIDIKDDSLFIKGLVPGAVNTVVVVKKVGENKKFVPLYKEEELQEEPKVEAQPDVQTAEETVQAAAEEVQTPAETVETTEQVQTPAEEKPEEQVKTEEKKEEVKENAG